MQCGTPDRLFLESLRSRSRTRTQRSRRHRAGVRQSRRGELRRPRLLRSRSATLRPVRAQPPASCPQARRRRPTRPARSRGRMPGRGQREAFRSAPSRWRRSANPLRRMPHDEWPARGRLVWRAKPDEIIAAAVRRGHQTLDSIHEGKPFLQQTAFPHTSQASQRGSAQDYDRHGRGVGQCEQKPQGRTKLAVVLIMSRL